MISISLIPDPVTGLSVNLQPISHLLHQPSKEEPRPVINYFQNSGPRPQDYLLHFTSGGGSANNDSGDQIIIHCFLPVWAPDRSTGHTIAMQIS